MGLKRTDDFEISIAQITSKPAFWLISRILRRRCQKLTKSFSIRITKLFSQWVWTRLFSRSYIRKNLIKMFEMERRRAEPTIDLRSWPLVTFPIKHIFDVSIHLLSSRLIG